MAFPKLSDVVVYPLQGLAGRVEDERWALNGGEGGSSVQCWSLKWEKWGQVENNKLSHLSESNECVGADTSCWNAPQAVAAAVAWPQGAVNV